MIITLTKTDLNSKSRIRRKLERFIPVFRDISKYYNEDEIFSLVLSIIRVNEMNSVGIEKIRNRTKYNIDTEKIKYWIEKRLVPNTIEISLNDKR